MNDFLPVLNVLLDEGIEITMKKFEGRIWYDLNTLAKSHLYITQGNSEEIEYNMRYEDGKIDCTLVGILALAKKSRCERDFMSSAWIELLLKHGFIKKKVVEVVSYE